MHLNMTHLTIVNMTLALSLNHSELSLNHTEHSLNHTEHSLNHIEHSLNHTEHSLKHTKLILNHTEHSLNHTELDLKTQTEIDISQEHDIFYNLSAIFENDSYLYDEDGMLDTFFNVSEPNATAQPLTTTTTRKPPKPKKFIRYTATSKLIGDLRYNIIGVFSCWIVTWPSLTINIMGMIVWMSREMKSTTALYMIAIGMYDLGFIIASFPMDGQNVYTKLTKYRDMNWFWDVFYPGQMYMMALKSLFQTSITWTAIMMTCDRVVGVWMPLRHSSICTKRRVQLALIFAHAMAWVIQGPRLGEYTLVKRYNMFEYRFFYQPNPTAFKKSYFYSQVYITSIYPTFELVIPTIIMVIANGLIVLKLVRMARKSKIMNAGSGGNEERDKATTRITYQALAISGMTIYYRLGSVIKYLLEAYYDIQYEIELPLVAATVIQCWEATYYWSAFINFFVFCYFGTKYRLTFLTKYGLTRFLPKKTKKKAADLPTNKTGTTTVGKDKGDKTGKDKTAGDKKG